MSVPSLKKSKLRVIFLEYLILKNSTCMHLICYQFIFRHVNDGCIAQSKKLSPAEFHDFAGFEMGTGGFILNPHSNLLFTLRM